MEILNMLGADEVHTQEDLERVLQQWQQEAEAERQKGIDKEREWRLLQEDMEKLAASGPSIPWGTLMSLARIAIKLGAGDWIHERLLAVLAAQDEKGRTTAVSKLLALIVDMLKKKYGGH